MGRESLSQTIRIGGKSKVNRRNANGDNEGLQKVPQRKTDV